MMTYENFFWYMKGILTNKKTLDAETVKEIQAAVQEFASNIPFVCDTDQTTVSAPSSTPVKVPGVVDFSKESMEETLQKWNNAVLSTEEVG